MLLSLLAACDPGYTLVLEVFVSSDVAEEYSPEEPAFVVAEGLPDMDAAALGGVCGGEMDLVFHLYQSELGCGIGGETVTVSLFPASALSPEEADYPFGCGSWEVAQARSFVGEADHVQTAVLDEPDDPENTQCGGNSTGAVRFR